MDGKGRRRKGKPSAASCDWRAKTAPAKGKKRLRVRIHRHRPDYSWSGVKTERYKEEDGTWSRVLRRVLAGGRGEEAKFHLRYFELAPGGHTTFEHHGHEHVVVAVRGRGRCRIRGRSYDLGFMDTLYVPPHAPHQLLNPHGEPFGFLCIVDADRDRPVPLAHGGKGG